jgi:predicted phosphodiesterase
VRVAVLSDVHGNRHAFEAALDAIDRARVDEVWCLGDLVGYGADPDACVDLAREALDVCLGGNHDFAVRGDLPLEEFSRGAELAARWTAEVARDDTLAFLHELEPTGERGPVGLFHGSPRDPVWEYVLSSLQAELCMDRQNHRVCLVGHSHVALHFHRGEGRPATGDTCRDGDELDLGSGEWILNPGSVGQPRDGDPRAAWLELDLSASAARYHRVEYDVAGAAAAIRAARLPDSLAERLRFGQ